jgi:hypothetical protein
MLFPDITCDHCDLSELERLSSKLLEVITHCSIQLDTQKASDTTVNFMKNKLMAQLELAASLSAVIDYSALNDRVGNFPAIAMENGRSKWVRIKAAVSEVGGKSAANDEFEAFALRAAEISHSLFSLDERMEVAALCIRRHDSSNTYHCDKKHCGEACEFVPVMCKNEGCGIPVSKKWIEKHDSVCVHKRVDCTRSCGEAVPRRLMEDHLMDHCDLRPVRCTYCDIGCESGM